MKIGILTLHSQQNYGGILQCFALKSALLSIGHEVVVIDRWVDEKCKSLLKEVSRRDVANWLKWHLKVSLRLGNYKPALRTFRTIRFVNSLGLTPYHFHEWTDAPADLGVDLVVVGSDQVWHCGDWGDPEVFLLEGADGRSPNAIAYAASFGMKSIPENLRGLYKRGLANFKAISCREVEGVQLCHDLGFQSDHVADPTLLVDPSIWNTLLNGKASSGHKRKLVCYFLGIEIECALPKLEVFAKMNDCEVEIMFGSLYPNKFKKYRGRVRICNDYGPVEFVRALASATWVLSDSFHAMMFTCIFGKDIRFLMPTDDSRRNMFARVAGFAGKYIVGDPFVESMDAAFQSFIRDEPIGYRREDVAKFRLRSMDWLRNSTQG